MHPAHRIRASDVEREATVAVLRAAVSEGRLTLDEFSQRSQLAYAATIRDQLAGLVADLPPAPTHWAPPPPRQPQADIVPMLAMIFGIVGLIGVACLPLSSLAAVAGVVLGSVGLARARRGTPGGRAMARVGLFCGAVAALLQVAFFLLLGLLSG